MADAQPIQQSNPSVPANPAPPAVVPSAEKIRVTVRNRTQVLFDEEAKSISSKNDTGVFDVLPEHSNFISLITSPLIIRKLDGEKKEITFTSGLIKVKENTVHCYVDLISQ
jgi:F0F1-type ATP synthase epsilon subunit